MADANSQGRPKRTRKRSGAEQGAAAAGASCMVMDREPAGRDLARMIVLGGYDSSIVENYHFRNFVYRLNPGFEWPSRGEVEHMCDDICDEETEVFLSWWLSYEEPRSCSVGVAETIEEGPVAYLEWHWIDHQWNLRRWIPYTTAWAAPIDRHGPLLEARESDHWGGKDVIPLSLLEKFARRICVTGHGITMPLTAVRRMVNKNIIADNYGLHVTITKFGCTDCMDNVFHSIAKCVRPLGTYFDVHSNHPASATTRTDEDTKYNLWLDIWRAIHRAIESISATGVPTSNLYLVELFNVRHVLDSESAAQVPCLTEAKYTLDRAIQDSYLLWAIPLVLDPRYKLNYLESNFKTAFGSEDAANMISNIKERIQDLFKKYPDSGGSSNNPSRDDSHKAKKELYRYLKEKNLAPQQGFGILKWWKEKGSGLYPTLARMARDALPIPTCSKQSWKLAGRRADYPF